MEKAYSDELQQMHDEMNSLKSLLKEQQIVNEQLMRKAMAVDYNKEKKEMWWIMVLAVLMTPFYAWLFPQMGIPLWFTLFTCAFFAAAIIATYYSLRRYVSQNVMTADLLTVATNIAAYKRFGNNWLKCSLPILCIWIPTFFYYAGRQMNHDEFVGMVCGGIIGGLIGAATGGWRIYDSRRRLNNILHHIEELKK